MQPPQLCGSPLAAGAIVARHQRVVVRLREPPVGSLASRRTEPREWNVWELERLAREQVSDDAVLNEERSYLLMYLREFANADGVLPADFDGVVRETFGDVLDAAYA